MTPSCLQTGRRSPYGDWGLFLFIIDLCLMFVNYDNIDYWNAIHLAILQNN